MKQPRRAIRIPHQRKVIGYVQGEVFFKRVKSSKHFLRQPPAIALDVQSLQVAKAEGATFVHVVDAERKPAASYWQRIATIMHKGFTIDRGHGRQIALPLDQWKHNIADLATQPTLF